MSKENSLDSSQEENPSIPKEIWAIGIGVFFVNLAAVMVRGFTAVYMKSLGVSSGWIGTIDGFNECVSFIMKMLSGVYSDYLRRRKLIIIIGYGLMLISRPIFAAASSVHAIIISRILERLGNGVQASPRDALVGDFAPKKIRGGCYGLKNSLATAGSFVGAFIGMMIMLYLNDFGMVFWWAILPASIAVFIMAVYVREPEKNVHPADHKPRHPIHFSDFPRLGRQFWLIMIVVSVFLMAQLGEWIMILHAHETFGLQTVFTPTVMMMYNLTYSSMSYPAGRLSDKIGRYNSLAVGFCFLIAGDYFLAMADSLWMVFAGIGLCGAQMAVTQSIFMSLVADSVPEDLRGTGFGIFYLVCAVSVFVSNTTLGHISDSFGKPTSFLISLGIAALSLIILFLIRKPEGKCLKS